MERETAWGAGWGDAGGVELLAGHGHGRSRFNTARRAFAVLNLISLQQGITAKMLSKELGVSLSTCYCLINILVEEGYVEKIAHRKGYRLGPAVSTLHSRAHNRDVEGWVEPVVEELALRSGRHAYFGLLSDGDVTVTRVESPKRNPPLDVVRASCTASHALAVGKVLIAGTGPGGIEDYTERHGLEAFTPRTITDVSRLKAHLAEVKRHGFATDVEEFSENLCCVAGQITDKTGRGVEGAIGISTTTKHFCKEADALVELVRRAAQDASELLG